MSTPCSEAVICRNSPANKGEQFAKCALCSLSPDNNGRQMLDYWKPVKGAPKRHPELERKRLLIKALAHMEDLRAKYNVDPKKKRVSKLAKQAEQRTESNIIKATKNSGRINKDGDHVAFNSITLDTKLQTTRTNPTINLTELEKVRQDSKRSGTIIGGLVIRNKHNVGCVVLSESDFAILMKRLNE
jgi:hypothetical protein